MVNATGRGRRPPVSPRQRAIRLEWLSVAWMLAEAAAAVTAGVIAGSLALTNRTTAPGTGPRRDQGKRLIMTSRPRQALATAEPVNQASRPARPG